MGVEQLDIHRPREREILKSRYSYKNYKITKTNSKWITGWNIRAKTILFLVENTVNFHNFIRYNTKTTSIPRKN